LELKPDNPNVYYNLGLAYEDLEQYENAVQAFQEANRIKPDYETYNSLGRVYNSMKKYQEALDSLQKSIKLNPENHYAHYNLGLTYEGLSNMKMTSLLTKKLFESKPIIFMPILIWLCFFIILIETRGERWILLKSYRAES
jgi:tetratricopeptide (TPR) repeat protein